MWKQTHESPASSVWERADGVRVVLYVEPTRACQVFLGDEPLVTTGRVRRRRWWRTPEAAMRAADRLVPLRWPS